MSPHAFRTRSPRPLVRVFCSSRLAAEALAQSYDRLLPDARRPVAPSAPTAPPRSRRTTFG
jgi:hypothetical protein